MVTITTSIFHVTLSFCKTNARPAAQNRVTAATKVGVSSDTCCFRCLRMLFLLVLFWNSCRRLHRYSLGPWKQLRDIVNLKGWQNTCDSWMGSPLIEMHPEKNSKAQKVTKHKTFATQNTDVCLGLLFPLQHIRIFILHLRQASEVWAALGPTSRHGWQRQRLLINEGAKISQRHLEVWSNLTSTPRLRAKMRSSGHDPELEWHP